MNKLLLTIVGLFLCVSPVFSQQTTNTETITVNASDLPPDVLAKIKDKQAITKVGEWVGVGKEVGEAVNSSLTALTKNASDFADTRLGKWTMFIVAYKVIGKDFVQVFVGFFLLCVLSIIWISFSIAQFRYSSKIETHYSDFPVIWQWFLGQLAIILMTIAIMFSH